MDYQLESLYLELLKKTLTFGLWEEPPVPLKEFNYQRRFYKKVPITIVSELLGWLNLELYKKSDLSPKEKEEGRHWPVYAHTMIGLKRLDNLQFCLESVIRNHIPGDLIEAGVWRGGACILMRAILAVHQIKERRLLVADSFQGLPPPDPIKYPQDRGDQHHTHSYLAISQEEVRENLKKYGLLDEQVVFLPGWFKDTLPDLPTDKLAVIRIDGDMYGSTREALTYLYPKLSPGGYCIVDDYALRGCRAAVDDFRAAEKVQEPWQRIDWTGIYWQKESVRLANS